MGSDVKGFEDAAVTEIDVLVVHPSDVLGLECPIPVLKDHSIAEPWYVFREITDAVVGVCLGVKNAATPVTSNDLHVGSDCKLVLQACQALIWVIFACACGFLRRGIFPLRHHALV